MNDLHSVLNRATNAIEAPGLFPVVLKTVRRRRTRRRGVGAGLVAAASVVAVVVATQAGVTDDRAAPPVGVPTSVPSVSPDGSGAFEPDGAELDLAETIQGRDVQTEWDPDDVLALPIGKDLVAPGTLSPPGSAVSLDDSPIDAAVSVVDTGAGLMLSNAAGEWRSLAYPSGRLAGYAVALSTAGSTVAVVLDSGVWWRNVTDREWNLIDSPPVRASQAIFLDDDVVALSDGRGSWSVDLRNVGTGWRALPFDLFSTGVGPDGTVVELRTELGQGASRFVDEWSDGSLTQTMGADNLEYIALPVVSSTSIVAAREASSYRYPRVGSDLDGLLAVERDGLTVRAYLPVPGDRGYYGRGGLRPLGWLDDDTVLVRVVPEAEAQRSEGTAQLITWNVRTGDLARTGASLPAAFFVYIAPELLAGGS